MALRTIFPKDKEQISRLYRQLYPGETPTEVDLTAESFEAKYFPICIEEDGEIAGLIVGTMIKFGPEKYGYIEDLVVEDGRKGRGLGSQLVEGLLKQLAAEGVQTVFVAISDSSETGPLGFYRKVGFRECENPWLVRSTAKRYLEPLSKEDLEDRV